MDPTDLAAGIDRGQDETDEALLQKMEQEQLSAAGSIELQGDGGYDQ